MSVRQTKLCPACGRRFAWRRKWARCWDRVIYCSEACRRRKGDPLALAIESAMLDLLEERGRGATICPSEAARVVLPDDWRSIMPAANHAMRRLAQAGRVVVTQRGRRVDAAGVRGPVRIALASKPR